ncbi:Decapping nuclease DXO homolog [Sergentomyia squamirostris]
MPVWNTGLCPLLKSSSHWRREEIIVPKPIPKLIGSFSVVNDEFVDSFQNVRYLCLPKRDVHWDLKTGIRTYSVPNQSKRRIDRVLKFMQTYPERVSVSGDNSNHAKKVIFPDFVCSRGFLSSLMKIPYPKKESSDRYVDAYPIRNKPVEWSVLATRVRGTIYFWWTNEWTDSIDGSPATYYGYKFRQMITTHELNKPSTIDQPVDREKFSGVFDTKLGKHRLLYAGEIFGVDSDVILKSHSDFLKPSVKIIQMHTKVKNMKYSNFLKDKLMHWWCKTVLIGAETVYAGNRTREGILESIEPIAVKKMPVMAPAYWSDSVCLKFTIAFLDMVKDMMKDIDDPDIIYKFSFNPNVSQQIKYEIFPAKLESSVLPSWYIDFLDDLAASGPCVNG